MKKLIILSVMLALVNSLSIAQNSNKLLGLESNTLSISVNGGVFVPVIGKYSSEIDTKDLLNSGPDIGISFTYSTSKMLSVRASYDFAYNNFESNYRPNGKEPAFVAPMITTDLILKFGSLIKGNNIVNPYCFSGVGLYFWKFSEDGTCGQGKGNAMLSEKGKEWKDCSFGLHTGIGIEVYINSNLSLFAEGQFRYIFSKNTDDFGIDFGNLGFIKTSGGLSYYF